MFAGCISFFFFEEAAAALHRHANKRDEEIPQRPHNRVKVTHVTHVALSVHSGVKTLEETESPPPLCGGRRLAT